MNTYSFFFSTPIPPEKIEEILGHNDFKVDNEEKMFTYYFRNEEDFLIVYRHYFNNDEYYLSDDQEYYDQEYDYYCNVS